MGMTTGVLLGTAIRQGLTFVQSLRPIQAPAAWPRLSPPDYRARFVERCTAALRQRDGKADEVRKTVHNPLDSKNMPFSVGANANAGDDALVNHYAQLFVLRGNTLTFLATSLDIQSDPDRFFEPSPQDVKQSQDALKKRNKLEFEQFQGSLRASMHRDRALGPTRSRAWVRQNLGSPASFVTDLSRLPMLSVLSLPAEAVGLYFSPNQYKSTLWSNPPEEF